MIFVTMGGENPGKGGEKKQLSICACIKDSKRRENYG